MRDFFTRLGSNFWFKSSHWPKILNYHHENGLGDDRVKVAECLKSWINNGLVFRGEGICRRLRICMLPCGFVVVVFNHDGIEDFVYLPKGLDLFLSP